jgi:hypothetical protein
VRHGTTIQLCHFQPTSIAATVLPQPPTEVKLCPSPFHSTPLDAKVLPPFGNPEDP